MGKVYDHGYHPARRAPVPGRHPHDARRKCCPPAKVWMQCGYYSLECWGGATFDACLRFLNEDPWERLRTAAKRPCPTPSCRCCSAARTSWATSHYADDVVDAFVQKSIENGIDVIRIFDALNDTRNLEAAIKATKKYGGMVRSGHQLHHRAPCTRRNTSSTWPRSWRRWARTPSASRTWPTCCCPIDAY